MKTWKNSFLLQSTSILCHPCDLSRECIDDQLVTHCSGGGNTQKRAGSPFKHFTSPLTSAMRFHHQNLWKTKLLEKNIFKRHKIQAILLFLNFFTGLLVIVDWL